MSPVFVELQLNGKDMVGVIHCVIADSWIILVNEKDKGWYGKVIDPENTDFIYNVTPWKGANQYE